MFDDLDRINRGEGWELGNNRWEIDGRIYVAKGDGKAYPASGPGVIVIPREQLNVVTMLFRHNGDEAAVRRSMSRDPQFDEHGDTIFAVALAIYRRSMAAKAKNTQ